MSIEQGTKVTIPVRFVVSAGDNDDWAVYMGWSNWTDEQIAKEGSKVSEKLGCALVEHLQDVEPKLRGFLDLHWRL